MISLSEVKPITNSEKARVILCLGESTTAWGQENSYPSLLQKSLDELFGQNKFRVINAGYPGINTSQILSSLEYNIKKYSPDIIITMIGINDIWSLTDAPSVFDDFRLYKLLKLIHYNLSLLIQGQPNDRRDDEFFSGTELFTAQRSDNNRNVPETYLKRIAQADDYFNSQNFSQAQFFYLEAEKIMSLRPQDNYNLAQCYLALGNRDQAFKRFDQYLALENSSEAFTNVGLDLLNKFGTTDKFATQNIENYFLHAINLDANNQKVLARLPIISFESRTAFRPSANSVELLKNALQKDPSNLLLITSLHSYYLSEHDNEKAEQVLRGGLLASGQDLHIWKKLLYFYLTTQQLDKLRPAIVLAEKIYPDNLLIGRFKKMHPVLFRERASVSNDVRRPIEPITRNNYIRIAQIIEEHGIQHVAMEYPALEITNLKNILQNFPKVLFVSNYETFKKQIAQYGFDSVFIDRFAVDFGHLNQPGNQLIADEVIRTLRNSQKF
ncbi:MAG: GDSL-type esterase/lipase family protein [Pseudobdellovibrio sp.]